jgi:hypothetical protein
MNHFASLILAAAGLASTVAHAGGTPQPANQNTVNPWAAQYAQPNAHANMYNGQAQWQFNQNAARGALQRPEPVIHNTGQVIHNTGQVIHSTGQVMHNTPLLRDNRRDR